MGEAVGEGPPGYEAYVETLCTYLDGPASGEGADGRRCSSKAADSADSARLASGVGPKPRITAAGRRLSWEDEACCIREHRR